MILVPPGSPRGTLPQGARCVHCDLRAHAARGSVPPVESFSGREASSARRKSATRGDEPAVIEGEESLDDVSAACAVPLARTPWSQATGALQQARAEGVRIIEERRIEKAWKFGHLFSSIAR